MRTATTEQYRHAEGPFWDAPRQTLLWVDITAGLVLSGVLDRDGMVTEKGRVTFPHTVGAVASSADGDWIIAGQVDILIRRSHGSVDRGPELLSVHSGRRLNDGKPDPSGRYVVGTLSLDDDSTDEQLFLLDGDDVTLLDDDLTLSNGLAWTADGRTMYSIDSGTRTIFRRDWPAGTREPFVTLEDGYPDGMTIDELDHLWVAIWGLGRLHRYSPDGQLAEVVEVPAPHVSSAVFAGPDLRTLVITTSTKDLTPEQLEQFPDSGRLFTFDPDIPGHPQPLWAGSAHRKDTP